MKRLLIISIIFISVTPAGIAQHIKRKGGLGVGYYQSLPDSIAAITRYKQGAVVQFVAPNTTAAALGLQKNDIITRINLHAINTPQQLSMAARSLREKDPVEILITRNNQSILLRGNVVAKPKETSSTAEIIYDEFAYNNGWIRTIYKRPANKKPLGTIYFLQGLPCYSMDNFKEQDITKLAIDAMVDRGFAVYRMEKADMGDNTNMPPCETMGFNEELNMYMAGYKNLLTLKYADTGNIFLFGHSMGGVTAPLLAEKFQPKAVVVYGTVFKPWMEYLLDAYRIQLQYYGVDLATIHDSLEAAKPYIYDYFYSDISIDEICKTKQGIAAMEMIMSYDANTKLGISGRAALVHKELNQHNLARAWGNTNGNVLAIYGECDIAANNADDHKALINYVNKIHPGKGQFWMAPKTTHTFEEIGTMEEFIEWQKDPPAYMQYAATRFNPKLFDYVCNWMNELLAKK